MKNKAASIDLDSFLTVADQFLRAGQIQEAEQIALQILLHDPANIPGNYMLGLIAYRTKNYAIAEKFMRTTLGNPSDNAYVYYKTLADIIRDQGRMTEAIEFYTKAITLKPDYIDALNSLGTIALINQNYNEAKVYYGRILAIKPDFTQSLFNLGLTHEGLSQLDEAKKYYLKTIAADPHFFQAYISVANVFKILENSEEAVKYYEQSLAIKPTSQAHNALGVIWQSIEKNDQAIKHYKAAVTLQPDNAEALNNLGSIYSGAGMYEEACALYEQVLKIQSSHPEALNNLGNTLRHLGQPDKAVSYYSRSLKITPENAQIYSNLLMTMLYAPSVSADELVETARKFEKNIAAPLLRTQQLNRDINPERKLRIGYVSPDFRNHAVNYFFEGVLKLHDRNSYEIYAYSNATNEDEITERLRKEFDHWCDIRKKDDDEVADIIESDQIDILVDLAGHTGKNRLLVFARKPAPIQVTWLGYPATTGMKAIDYRITDHYAEPEGMTEHLNIERLWRLPQIFCCYGAHDNNPVVIDHPPFQDNGYITFGCFNNFAKVTDTTLQIWKKIMERVPECRLYLEINGLEEPKFCAWLDERLKHLNMPVDRIILEPRKRENQFILYNKIDIALDPFPCAGGTTSMDTLWMGVPLITLAGKHFVSRMGVTILTNVGLSELIAQNTDEYVSKAMALANDHERLQAMRHNMRDRVVASPMMDQVTFTRNMEDAYRGMWRIYCAEKSHEK